MDILKIIADNPALLGALKTLILEQFSVDEMDTHMTNDELGQKVRARVEGMQKVEDAFKKILSFKSVPSNPIIVNPAR